MVDELALFDTDSSIPDELLAKHTVPRAVDDTGRQEGRPGPSERTYTTTNEVVTADEAERRLRLRQEGKLPPLQTEFNPKKQSSSNSKDKRRKLNKAKLNIDNIEIDTSSSVTDAQDYDPLDVTDKVIERVTTSKVDPMALAMADYIKKRMRVTLELSVGSLFITVVDVKECDTGLVILVPILDEMNTFIPKSGSELDICYNNRKVHCYFPGVHFKCNELGILGLVFVKAEV